MGCTNADSSSYPEDGYAFPQLSDTVISAPNATLIRLWVGDEPLDLRTGTVLAHEQVLDLRAGVIERQTEWISPAGDGVYVSAAAGWCRCPVAGSPPSTGRSSRWTRRSTSGSARTCWPTRRCRNARTTLGPPR